MTNMINKNLREFRPTAKPRIDWSDIAASIVLVIVALVVIGLMLVMGFAPEVLL